MCAILVLGKKKFSLDLVVVFIDLHSVVAIRFAWSAKEEIVLFMFSYWYVVLYNIHQS